MDPKTPRRSRSALLFAPVRPTAVLTAVVALSLFLTAALPVPCGADTLRIAAFLPLTRAGASGTTLTSLSDYQVRTAIQIAIDEANSDPAVLPGHELELVVRNTSADPNVALTEARDILINTPEGQDRPVAIIGARFSSVSLPVSWVSSSLHVPMVSYASTAVTFSDRSTYPYFFRTVPADEFQGRALVSICNALGVARLAFLYSDDSYGRGGFLEFQEHMGHGMEITYSASHPENMELDGTPAVLEALRNDFAQLRETTAGFPTRVVLIFSGAVNAPFLFQAASEENVTSTGYAIICSESLLSPNSWSHDAFAQDLMQGVLGPTPMSDQGPLLSAFSTKWYSTIVDNLNSPYYGSGPMPRHVPFAYDATRAAITALHNSVSAGNLPSDGVALLEQLVALNITAVTVPRLVFLPNGDVPGTYSIVNLQGSNFAPVGSWIAYGPEGADATLSLNMNSIHWPGGSTVRPFSPRSWACALIREPGNELNSEWTKMSTGALQSFANEYEGFQYGWFTTEELEKETNFVEALLKQFEYYHDLGYQLFLAPNFQIINLLAQQTAARYPSSKFIAIDSAVPGANNVYSVLFREDEGAFLAGVLAGQVSLTKRVACLAGPPFPPLRRFSNGFKNGVHHVCPECYVDQYFLPGFSPGFDPFASPELGRSVAGELVASGADVLFGAAGATGVAAIQAAAANGTWVIGVDTDEWITSFASGGRSGSSRVLTSVVKQIYVPIDDALHRAVNPNVTEFGKVVSEGLSANAMNLAPCHEACTTYNSYAAAVEDARTKLIAGTLLTGVSPTTGLPFIRKTDCPPGTRFVKVPSDPSKNACEECPQDYFNMNGDGVCYLCPVGAVCRGGSKVKALQGYWRSSNDSLGIYEGRNSWSLIECPLPNTCLGASALMDPLPNEPQEACATGYRGNLCYNCAKGYGHSGVTQGCSTCPDSGMNTLIILAGVVIIAAMSAFMIRSQLNSTGENPRDAALVFKVLMSWLQVVALMSALEVDWPQQILALFSAESSAAAGGQSFVNFDCALDRSQESETPLVYQKALLFALLPVFCIVVPALIWAAAWLFIRYVLLDRPTWVWIERYIVSVIVLLFMFHPNVTASVLTLITCSRGENDQWYLISDPDIDCSSESHKRWLWGLALPTAILAILGIPAAAVLVLRIHRDDLDNELTRKKYGFLYGGYRTDRYYWEAIITLRKVGIVVADITLASYGALYQALGATFVVFVALILSVYQHPFEDDNMNSLEEASLSTSFLTLYIGLLFAGDGINSAMKLFLVVVLIILNVSFLVMFAKQFLAAVHEMAREKIQMVKRRRSTKVLRREKMKAGKTVEMSEVTRDTLGFTDSVGVSRVIRRESAACSTVPEDVVVDGFGDDGSKDVPRPLGADRSSSQSGDLWQRDSRSSSLRSSDSSGSGSLGHRTNSRRSRGHHRPGDSSADGDMTPGYVADDTRSGDDSPNVDVVNPIFDSPAAVHRKRSSRASAGGPSGRGV